MRGQTGNRPPSAPLLIILWMTLLSMEAPEPTPFLSSGWPYPSFYLSIFDSPMYLGFLDMQNLFFLVLICLTSIWLLDQPKEPLKGRGKFFLPNTAKRATCFFREGRREGKEKLSVSLSCFKILCNDPITHTLSLSHIPHPQPRHRKTQLVNTHSSILGFP